MLRRTGIFLAIFALIALAIALLARAPLARWAFHNALDRNVGVDQSARLGDGLHAYVCGSGSPMPDADRAGPCIAVLAGHQGFIFDSGSGSVRKLMRMGFPIQKLQAEFLTHLHSDHIDGLGEALLQAWVGGHRSAPLPVYGPPGTDRVVAGFNQAYVIDSGYRVAHHGAKVVRPAGFGGAAQIIALAPGVNSQPVYDRDGVRITVILVDHGPVKPAYGYRIDYRGRAIAISGDTVYSPGLVTAAKGADVMFHEALNNEMVSALGAKLAERGQADNARIMHDIQNYHASPADAARAASQAGVSTLVLYHLVPPLPSRLIEPMFLGDAPAIFGGQLLVGKDGMIISLPAGSKAVKVRSAW